MTFALMDAGGDYVALCDSGESGGAASVVGQWVYDAYGNVISADHLYSHAFAHVGHKGLFIDRLDAGVADHGDDEDFEPGMFLGHVSCEFDVPRVVPFAKHLYHNRNRAYLPSLGRFAQADPNASGMCVMDILSMHGDGFVGCVPSFGLTQRYSDGGNLFGYLGQSPWGRNDPSGLFALPSPLDLAGTLVTGGIKALRGGLENMIGEYTSNMELDFEWSSDWSQLDDWHTRGDNSWVAPAFEEGVCNALFDWLENDVMSLINPLQWIEDLYDTIDQQSNGRFVEARGGGGGRSRGGRIGRRTSPPRSWLNEARKVNGKGLIAHHIVSWYGKTKVRIRDLSRRYNIRIDLQNPRYNLLALPKHIHGNGRHLQLYHERVYKYIERRLEGAGKYGREAMVEFEKIMGELKVMIEANPRDWFGPAP